MKWNLYLGHMDGSSKNPRLKAKAAETSGKGLLIMLANLLAVLTAIGALIASLTDYRKQ